MNWTVVVLGAFGALMAGVVLSLNGVDVRNGIRELVTVGFCGMIAAAAMAGLAKAFS